MTFGMRAIGCLAAAALLVTAGCSGDSDGTQVQDQKVEINVFWWGGRLGGRIQKAPVCILHTVGCKSGKRRETPLLYLADGDKVVLVASAGGRETSPAWYHNLRAMDAAEVEILGRRTQMTPRLASAEERARYWPKVNEIYSDYDAYQTRTKREIPVLVMSPA